MFPLVWFSVHCLPPLSLSLFLLFFFFHITHALSKSSILSSSTCQVWIRSHLIFLSAHILPFPCPALYYSNRQTDDTHKKTAFKRAGRISGTPLHIHTFSLPAIGTSAAANFASALRITHHPRSVNILHSLIKHPSSVDSLWSDLACRTLYCIPFLAPPLQLPNRETNNTHQNSCQVCHQNNRYGSCISTCSDSAIGTSAAPNLSIVPLMHSVACCP